MAPARYVLEGFALHADAETNSFRVNVREGDTVEQLTEYIKKDLLCSNLVLWKVCNRT
jgi:hypothetical protein